MERKMNLIREILFKIEKDHSGPLMYSLNVPEYTDIETAYHCELMYEANLINRCNIEYGDDDLDQIIVGGLTWTGHDYLEKIRDDEKWEKMMKTVEEKKLPKTLETISRISGIFVGNIISELK